MIAERNIEQEYQSAKDIFAEYGVDTEEALRQLEKVSVSIHCWQADDLTGTETGAAELGASGLAVTGAHPGKARNAAEIREDLAKTLELLPGTHRINIHAMYGEFNGKVVDKDEITPEHFSDWAEWAQQQGIMLDFNCTNFGHPKAADGFTISHSDEGIRNFWIEHVQRSREITAYLGSELGGTSIHNLWIPDGYKDVPYDADSPRQRLKESLDTIFSKSYPEEVMLDSVESKLFGIGSEAYVVGSYDFYLAYTMKNNMMICLDMGHYHPTESVGDKISSIMRFSDKLLLHVSRGLRWDSDHIPVLNDEVSELANRLVRGGHLENTFIALDFFDGSVSRVGGYTVGTTTVLKSVLRALLEPAKLMKQAEDEGDFYKRMALMEESKTLPLGAVWDYHCHRNNVPAGLALIEACNAYQHKVVNERS